MKYSTLVTLFREWKERNPPVTFEALEAVTSIAVEEGIHFDIPVVESLGELAGPVAAAVQDEGAALALIGLVAFIARSEARQEQESKVKIAS